MLREGRACEHTRDRFNYPFVFPPQTLSDLLRTGCWLREGCAVSDYPGNGNKRYTRNHRFSSMCSDHAEDLSRADAIGFATTTYHAATQVANHGLYIVHREGDRVTAEDEALSLSLVAVKHSGNTTSAAARGFHSQRRL